MKCKNIKDIAWRTITTFVWQLDSSGPKSALKGDVKPYQGYCKNGETVVLIALSHKIGIGRIN